MLHSYVIGMNASFCLCCQHDEQEKVDQFEERKLDEIDRLENLKVCECFTCSHTHVEFNPTIQMFKKCTPYIKKTFNIIVVTTFYIIIKSALLLGTRHIITSLPCALSALVFYSLAVRRRSCALQTTNSLF